MYGSHQLYECVCAETNSPAALLPVQPAAGRHLRSGRLQPGVCPHDGLFIWGILLFFGQVFLFVVCTYMNTCIYVYIHRGLQHTCTIGHMYFYWPSLTIWISHLSQLKTNSNFNSENKSLTLEVKFLFQSALSTVECTRTHTHAHTHVRARACVRLVTSGKRSFHEPVGHFCSLTFRNDCLQKITWQSQESFSWQPRPTCCTNVAFWAVSSRSFNSMCSCLGSTRVMKRADVFR